MTPSEREEGRRLLVASHEATLVMNRLMKDGGPAYYDARNRALAAINVLSDWLLDHAEELLDEKAPGPP